MSKEILKRLVIDKLDNVTVNISNKEFNFTYTVADSVVKDEYRGKYRYFGGLQCNFDTNTDEYKELEKDLCRIAETVLTFK